MTEETNPKELQVTLASEWRKTEKVQFPSGNVAIMQSISMVSMILSDDSGDVPDLITAQVVASLQDGPAADTRVKVSIEDLRKMDPFIKRVAAACMVNPRVVDNPNHDDGEIGYEEMIDEDKGFLLTYVMSGGKVAAEMAVAQRFRKRKAAVVEPGANGRKVRAKAK